MSKEDDDVRLPMLSGDNYCQWAMKMRLILTAKGLEDIVLQDSKSEDKRKAARASMVIVNSLDDKNLAIIAACGSPREIWTRLESEYSEQETIGLEAVLTEFYSLKKKPNQSISEYVAYVYKLVLKMSQLGRETDKDAQMAKIISGLPADYFNFKRTWDMSAASVKTPELLLSMLKKEEAALKPGSSNEALLARRKPNKGNSNNRANKKDIDAKKASSQCKYCGTTGHWWSECPTRPSDWKPPRSEKDNSRRGNSKNDNAKRVQKPVAGQNLPALSAITHYDDQNAWLLDSGCSIHMTGNRGWIEHYEPLETPESISFGDGSVLYAQGKGVVYLMSDIGNKEIKIQLTDVYYVPKAAVNLFSVGRCSILGTQITFLDDKVKLNQNGKMIATGFRANNNIYRLNFRPCSTANIARSDRTVEEWHRVLGHAGVHQVEKLAKLGCVDGMQIVREPTGFGCGGCSAAKGKHCSHPPSDRPRATTTLERLHVDLVGPIKPLSLGGRAYFITIKDEFSSYLFARPIVTKADVWKDIKQLLDEIEALTHQRAKIIRSDNGSEFKNQDMAALCYSRGIYQEFSAPYTPQQNGEAERANQTLINTATAMIHDSPLSLELWAEAVCTAAYVRNRVISTRTDGKTPFELFHKRKPNISNLLAFGQELFVYDDYHPKQSKFSPKMIEAFMVGYGPRVNTYRCFLKGTKEVRVTSNISVAGHTSSPKTARQIDRTKTVSIDDARDQIAQISAPIYINDVVEPVYSNDNLEGQSTSYGDESVIEMPTYEPTAPAYGQDENDQIEIVSEEQIGPSTPSEEIRYPSLDNPTTPIMLRKAAPTVYNRQTPQSFFIDLNDQMSRINRERLDNRRPSGREMATTSGQQARATTRLVSGSPAKNIVTNIINASRNLANSYRSDSDKAARSAFMSFSAIMKNSVPASYSEALASPERANWLTAISNELNAHKKNGTWSLANRPADKQEISARWVFRIKDDGTFKARLVARGFAQVAGRDYDDVYAPVVRMDSVRLLFSICAQQELHYAQFDITTSFLYGTIDEESYMSAPEGLSIPKGKSLRLHRSLYGLKQAPRCWNNRFSSMLKKFQMQKSNSDPCVYISVGQHPVYLALYVDDGLIFCKDEAKIQELLKYLKREFEIRIVTSQCFLGLQIEKDPSSSTIFLHQKEYIKRVLSRYGMNDSKVMPMPMELNHPLNKEEILNSKVVTNIPYAEAIGSLLYCAMGTRPDICYALSVLSKYTSAPRAAHWSAVKRVFRYLKGTADHGLLYKKTDRAQLICYTDADWGGDHTNRRSISGMVTTLGTGPISYHAQQQSSASLSTTESEYIAASVAVQEVVWLKRFLDELKMPYARNTVVRCDNQSALKLIKNPEFHKRTKHIDIRYHFIREQYERKTFTIEYIKTEVQPADIFTKSMTVERHQMLCELIGCIRASFIRGDE